LVWHKGITLAHLLSVPIVIATYGKLAVTKKRELSELHKVEWGRVIFDEAHHMRNKKTGAYMGGKLVRGASKWLVTGTPIQNFACDFKSLCAVLGIASSKTDDLAELKREYMLRRTKQEVGLSLMPAEESEISVPWASGGESRLACDIHAALPFNSGAGFDSSFAFDLGDYAVLKLMMKARQVCAFPPILEDQMRDAIIGPKHPYLCGLHSMSKMDSLLALLFERKNNGNGKIVFCQFHKEIDFLLGALREQQFDAVIFDGRVSLGARRNLLKCPHDVLIMQIQAGCEGLNLQQHYSEVYFLSPHWNPAMEDQAVARCHRFGQTKRVRVQRFLSFPGATPPGHPPASLLSIRGDPVSPPSGGKPPGHPPASLRGDPVSPPASLLSMDQYIQQVQFKKRTLY
jgi:SNF2 family DNA or RNA helicase